MWSSPEPVEGRQMPGRWIGFRILINFGSKVGLQPSMTPPSIANTIWAVQASNETYINPPSGKELTIKEANKRTADEFTKWSSMKPEEFIRARYLGAHNLTEDDLKAMSTDERAAIEKEIAEQIKRELADIEGDGDGTTDPKPTQVSNTYSAG